MSRGRSRLLIYAFAAIFLFYYVVMVYAELWRPRRVGLGYEFTGRGMRVSLVIPNTPAARAGIAENDFILAVDGTPVRSWTDWNRFLVAREVGREYRVVIERAGQRDELVMNLQRYPEDPFGPLERKRYLQFLLVVLAIGLALRRPRQVQALVAALLLAAVGTAGLFPEPDVTAVWRDLPWLAGALLWLPLITQLLLLPLFFSFFALFPRPLFAARWPWLLIWAPPVITSIVFARDIYRYVYRPEQFEGVPQGAVFWVGLGIVVYGVAGLGALLANYKRLDPAEQNRMKVFLAGSLIGWAPALPFLAATFWSTLTRSPAVWFFLSTPYRIFALVCFAAFPMAFAYSAAKYRILDIGRDPAELAAEQAARAAREQLGV